MQERGDQPRADDEHQRDEDGDLAERQRQRLDQRDGSRGRLAFQRAGKDGQQDQHQHHGEVLDDEPAHGDAPALGLDQPPLLQQAEQHHGARHGKGDAEDEPGSPAPALPPAERHGQRDGEEGLGAGAGNGDAAYRQQVLKREMQADAEHQEDDADLGELVGDGLVGDEARRERADSDAGEEVAHEWRQAQALGGQPEGKSEHETDDDG